MVTDLTGHTQCQRIGALGVGIAEVIAAGINAAVDDWSWVGNNTEVCLQGNGAAMVFLDADHMPRTVEALAMERRGDYSCATIPHQGSVVLLESMPAGMSQQRSTVASAQPLLDCHVTLQAPLNLREVPHGAMLKVLPASDKLTALEYADGWYLVDYHGEHGWVSAHYVTSQGSCA